MTVSTSGTVSCAASVTTTQSNRLSFSAVPSASAAPSISTKVSATASATSSSSSTATTSFTSTATYRVADPQSSTPSPRPIVNLEFSLSNVQISLFLSNELSLTFFSFAKAISFSIGVSPSSVSFRRIRDISFPLTPSVIWLNPAYAGDVFPFQRRLQESTTGIISVDVQINVVSTAVASKLSSTLATSIAKVVADVSQSLINQGSPLATAQISASVEPFSVNSGSTESLQRGFPLEIAVPIFAGGFLMFAGLFAIYYVLKRDQLTKITPELVLTQKDNSATETINDSHNKNMSMDKQTQKLYKFHQNTDPEIAIAKIVEDFDNSTALLTDKKEAIKAQQEATMQERIAQRELMKARVARKKAEEYKAMILE